MFGLAPPEGSNSVSSGAPSMRIGSTYVHTYIYDPSSRKPIYKSRARGPSWPGIRAVQGGGAHFRGRTWGKIPRTAQPPSRTNWLMATEGQHHSLVVRNRYPLPHGDQKAWRYSSIHGHRPSINAWQPHHLVHLSCLPMSTLLMQCLQSCIMYPSSLLSLTMKQVQSASDFQLQFL